MLGRLVTALAGHAVGRTVGGERTGLAGLVVGTAVPMIARRFGPLGLIGLAAGTYAVTKLSERRSVKPARVEPRRKPPLP